MATRSSNFEIAATDDEEVRGHVDENVVEINHGGGNFSLWRRPKPGSFSMMQVRMARSSWEDNARGLDRFISRLVLSPEEVVAGDRVDGEGVLYSERIEDGEHAVGMEWFMEAIEDARMPQEALLDMVAVAIEEHAGFPTEQPSSSSSGQNRAGRRSTANSRRVGSTPSA